MSGTSTTTPDNYQPVDQSQDANDYQNILQGIEGQISSGTTPGQLFWPSVQTAVNNTISNPYQQQALGAAESGAAGGQQVQATGLADMGALTSAGNQVLSTGFDPQQALYNQQQGQVINQSNVANAMAGLGSSPYGASNTANTLSNFDINWQNNQLARQAQASSAAATDFSGGLTAGTSGINTGINTGAAPYNTYNTTQSNDLSALTTGVNTGNQQYTVPQTVLSDLMSYLNLGQNASAEESQINSQNLANTESIFGGLGQGLGGLANLAGFGSGAGSGTGSGSGSAAGGDGGYAG
jgi:hypothetical protein